MKKTSTPRALFELLSSMRFAISLLTILAIASIIGTVLKQHDSYNAYLNQFGPFWFPIFERLGLYGVYNAGWFLLILAFLVGSTSICILRHTRPMLREMRGFKEHARESSLRLFHHHAELAGADFDASHVAVRTHLASQGFALRENPREDGVLVVGKRGAWSRMGYFLAHGGLVIICLGGLLDGDLPLKAQLAFGGKQVTPGDRLDDDIPAASRLAASNWSYRGNVFIPEGKSADQAVLSVGDGILLQELPFIVSLKQFHIEHYSTGQPKRFASDIILTDKASGKSIEKTIEVNKPFEYAGISLYQASFEDGGSRLDLRAFPLGGGPPLTLTGVVGEHGTLKAPGADYTVEYTDFRPFNIENMADAPSQAKGMAVFTQHLGSGAKPEARKDFRNVGASFQYKLRDSAGQAREFLNYMLPLEQDGRWFQMLGLRESAAEPFRFMHLPLDEDGKLDTWFAIRARLIDPAQRAELAHRFALAARGKAAAEGDHRLEETTARTIAIFARSGFQSLGQFIEKSIPAAERERAADIFLQVLEGVAWQAWQMERETHGQPALMNSAARAQYIRDAVNAVSDSFQYPAPFVLQLTGFHQVQATVLQATRSPGKKWVYLGSLLLVAGVFAMLYVRERRLFALVKRDGSVLLALSSNRASLDVGREFEHHRSALAQRLAPVDQESQ
ncbi:cytochrome c biogenesis protein ResB [Niveibacterium sp. SC-1]|uniref:cytochrome c biogenesis protein ResB n=1 Tax=Niveibacterium sp. SC-1 TaxID=3135646 RepID=UPI00312053BE